MMDNFAEDEKQADADLRAARDGRVRLHGRTAEEHRAASKDSRLSALHWMKTGAQSLALSQRRYADRCVAWARKIEQLEGAR